MAAKGGVKGSLMSGVIMFILLGGIVGWMRVNNIHDAGQAWDYFRALSHKSEECADGEGLWHCKENIKVGSGTNNGSGINVTEGKDYTIDSDGKVKIPTGGASKPNNPDLSALNGLVIAPPSLGSNIINDKGVTTTTPKDILLKALDKAVIKEKADKVNYKRSEWRHWIGEPCNTRNQVLIKQGKNVKVTKTAHSCKVTSGDWTSPYDNKKFTKPIDLDIDHIAPLGWVAAHGGQSWSAAKKEKFANDQNQLVAVSAHSNRSKSDKGPAEYMPDDSYKCEYSKKWVYDINKYGLFISSKEKSALKDGINSCS